MVSGIRSRTINQYSCLTPYHILIQARQLPAHRCIHVCPDGPGELVVLKDIMQSRLVPATTFENVQTRRA